MSTDPLHLNMSLPGLRGSFEYDQLRDRVKNELLGIFQDELVVQPCSFYWLSDQHNAASL